MPKIIFMPHANIQYSQLAPEKRLWVMENCYEKLFDLIDGGNYKIAFEASGITIEEMAKQAPHVLAKLRKLVAEGKVEPAACGESDMDWKAILDALKDFDGPALFEYENTEDIEAGSRKCFEYIRNL